MKLCSALHIHIPVHTKIIQHSSMYFQNTWQQCIKYNHGCMLALCSYTQRWKTYEVVSFIFWSLQTFFPLSIHITRFAEGKVNKLCPAAGTQSRETSCCWGWVSSSRLVTKNAEPSDRGALFSSQKIPAHPGKLMLTEASSQRFYSRV